MAVMRLGLDEQTKEPKFDSQGSFSEEIFFSDEAAALPRG